MALNLNDKVAVITGASSGIGEACAILFSELGAQVVLIGRNLENLKKVKQLCDKNSKKHLILQVDITEEEALKKAVEQIVEAYGKIDILVNNAGIGALGSIEETSLSQFDSIMNTNIRAAYHMTMLCVPHLINSKGNIINVSSVASEIQLPRMLAYSVSKAALDQLTKCSALELASKGVRVNSINPGLFITKIQDTLGLDAANRDQLIDQMVKMTPMGRAGELVEVARSVAFLASDWASDTTAELLHCDGGFHVLHATESTF